MMDCREARELLPLWIGQDLPDAATSNRVSQHLSQCPECARRRAELQRTGDVLQCLSAEAFSVEPIRQSILPKLMVRISDWDNLKYRRRFNGWIPAAAMSLAAGLMIAVSIPSIHDEFFGGHTVANETTELIGADFGFNFDGPDKSNAPGAAQTAIKPSKGTPVVYRPDQW